MRRVRTAVLAGIAAMAVAGAAMAAGHDTHYLNVAMPDGSVARVAYKGDTPPTVTVAPATSITMPVALFDPFDAAPFAMFDHIATQMDQQADRMMQEVAALTAQAPSADGRLDMAAFGTLPAGTVH